MTDHGHGDGFRVDKHKLGEVAKQVFELLNDVRGGSGGYPGNHRDFTRDGSTSNMSNALNSLFPEAHVGNAFVEAYNWEYEGLDAKYKAIIDQLTQVLEKCDATAGTYHKIEQATVSDINSVNPGSY